MQMWYDRSSQNQLQKVQVEPKSIALRAKAAVEEVAKNATDANTNTESHHLVEGLTDKTILSYIYFTSTNYIGNSLIIVHSTIRNDSHFVMTILYVVISE